MIKDIEDLSHGEGLFDLNSSWVEHAPEDAARILSANFDAWYRLDATGTPFKSYEGGSGPSHHLIELTKVRPVAMLDAVLPAMVITMQRMPGEGAAPRQDMVWHWRRHEADESLIEFLDIVRAAFARAAVSAPDEVARLIGIIDPANEITSLYLLLETVAHNGKQLAGLLAQQKDNPALFEAGPQGSPAHSAAVALSAVWDWLDPADRDHFETRILGLWSEFDDVRWALSLRDPEKNRFLKKSETDIRDIARRYLAQSGRRQWSVLRTIDASRLSPTVCERLALFERKFASQDPESPSASRSGSVHSPIAPDRAAHMSDDAWISAFGGMGEGDRGWSEWGFRGGAYELARVLQARVKQQPDRFVELASRMPATADPSFINGIVMGLSEANPTPTQTERLLELIDQGDGPAPDDRSVVWLIRATKGEKGDRALAFVLQAATARDNDTAVGDISRPANDKPEPEFKRALALGSKLESEAVNATRGAALIEIGSQSWASKDKFEKYRPIVEPMIGSDMPDFLHASLNPMLVAAIKHDRAIATDWIARTAKKSPSGLFTSNGRRALFNLDVLEHDAAAPIIIGLADSTDSLEQAIGCLLVTHRSLDDGRWNAKVDELIERGPVQRAAVAEIAVAYVAQAAHFSRASSWLIRFFEDDDETVRTTAVDCFRRIDPDEMASYVQLYEAYVGSKYFNAERTSFLHRLDKAPAAMSDVVLGLIEKTVAVAKSRGPKNTSLSTYQIWDPLLRIYASSSAVYGDHAALPKVEPAIGSPLSPYAAS